jgi:hypothetical protein
LVQKVKKFTTYLIQEIEKALGKSEQSPDFAQDGIEKLAALKSLLDTYETFYSEDKQIRYPNHLPPTLDRT